MPPPLLPLHRHLAVDHGRERARHRVRRQPRLAAHGESGVFGVHGHPNAAELTYYGLYALQHRGQESAGIVSCDGKLFRQHKGMGLVPQVFKGEELHGLIGNMAIGHTRYSTTGSSHIGNAQPLTVDCSRGQIAIAHNGNLTNTDALETLVRDKYMRHINTDSDSELLLNIFAEEMAQQAKLGEDKDDKDKVFSSISNVLQNCEGGYAGMYLVNGIGIVGFRDPHGIRPIVLGSRPSPTQPGTEPFP